MHTNAFRKDDTMLKKALSSPAKRIALLVLAGGLAIGGAVSAGEIVEEATEGKGLDPVQGSVFSINNSTLTNAAWTSSSSSFRARPQRVGQPTYRLVFDIQQTNASEKWDKYE